MVRRNERLNIGAQNGKLMILFRDKCSFGHGGFLMPQSFPRCSMHDRQFQQDIMQVLEIHNAQE